MAINVLTKAKAGVQDLLVGLATVIQERNGTNYNIDSIPLVKPVVTVAEITALDVSTSDLYFQMLMLQDGINDGMFYHDTTIAQSTADGINVIVDSTAGPNGCWIRATTSGVFEKSWGFASPAASTGAFYFGGYYSFGATANDFNPVVNFGTANSSYAAHVMVVTAAGGGLGTDTIISVTGTSITDSGALVSGDVDFITIPHNVALNTYFEMSKKFLGIVNILKVIGPDILCNYGLCKYWDNNNTAFTLLGLEVLWLGGATDTGADIEVIHHKATGWTYNVAAEPDPSIFASLTADHNVDNDVVNNENGAWKRSNFSQAIAGDASEGTIVKITTTANKAFEVGTISLRLNA